MDNHIFLSKLKSSFRKRTRFRQGTSLTCSKKMSSATLSPDDRYITIGTFKIPSRPSAVSYVFKSGSTLSVTAMYFFPTLDHTNISGLQFGQIVMYATLYIICIYITHIFYVHCIIMTLLIKTIISRSLRKYKNKYYCERGRKDLYMRYASFYSTLGA